MSAHKRREPEPELELRLLGPLEVWRRGAREPLPRSKKTRALLAYLAVTGRPHSRQQLCDLFWELTDDPRGALRWSLSKLRGVVNDDDERIVADRERVELVVDGARVDAVDLSAAVARGVPDLPTGELERLAALARGEFLEGLELPDYHAFQAWLVAQREATREARSTVLAELVHRLQAHPEQALPHARARVHADALSVDARIELLAVLLQAGRPGEAQRQFEIGRRMFAEVEAQGLMELDRRWRTLSRAGGTPAGASGAATPGPGSRPTPEIATPTPRVEPFVGRTSELERLRALLDEARGGSTQRIALVTGEPGAGKSTLARRLVDVARQSGLAVLEARAYEAESSRPFGPWVEALGIELRELVPGLDDEQSSLTRDALFTAVAHATAERAARSGGALLLLDDLQWMGGDSAEVLHAVVRTNRQRPILVVLLARTGELADNEPVLRALRSLRREVQIEELPLAPMTRAEIGMLVGEGDEADRIFGASAGNPLYALELARAAAGGRTRPPASLVEIVRDRMEQLPAHAAEVLRWCAVLGHAARLSRLESLSSLPLEELVDALERLEQHALLRLDDTRPSAVYMFAHDVVREAAYGDLSQPRRRLMHGKVARALEEGIEDPVVATEVARHASLAGDASRAVRACVVAGREALRVLANSDADALARRGLGLVDQLDEKERVVATLELLHVQYAARTPDREEAGARVRPLTERALDLGLTAAARLGFQMLSYLRWETGSMAAAHRLIMRAERISRSADPRERTIALAQAAKCLVLLERDVPLAESWLLEAEALADRQGHSPSAMRFAVGMLHERRGAEAEAAEAFQEARELGRQQGDRLAELNAVEHLTMLEIDRGNAEAAVDLAAELVELASRVRPGAEAAHARGLLALARRLRGDATDQAALSSAMEELRLADSKYRLAFLMTRVADLELEAGNAGAARAWAADALTVATDIGRASEVALARYVLLRCAEEAGDPVAVAEQLEAVDALDGASLTSRARARVEALVVRARS